eukprot:552369-Pelagomonas_calceolata.AAC.5
MPSAFDHSARAPQGGRTLGGRKRLGHIFLDAWAVSSAAHWHTCKHFVCVHMDAAAAAAAGDNDADADHREDSNDGEGEGVRVCA